MDDELAALQAELAAVQKGSGQDQLRHLNERHAVDLVLKLRKLGRLRVIPTLTGKEFLTPERLRDEVSASIRERGGRARLVELSATLNVDLGVVEEAARAVVADSGDQLRFSTPGEVVSEVYLDRVCREIDEVLQATGSTTIGSIATDYDLPVEVVRESLTSRLGTILRAELHLSTLFTSAHVQTMLAELRGTLAGVTRPTALGPVVQEIGLTLQGTELENQVMALGVPGTIRGGQFWPEAFVKTQRHAVDAHFSTNGVFPLSLGKKMLLAKGQLAYLRESFPDAVLLDGCIVSQGLVDAFTGAVQDCINFRSFLDPRNVLPNDLTEADCSMLIDKTKLAEQSATKKKKKKTAKAIVLGPFIISCAFMEDLQDRARQIAAQAGREAAAQLQRSSEQFTIVSAAASSGASASGAPKSSRDQALHISLRKATSPTSLRGLLFSQGDDDAADKRLAEVHSNGELSEALANELREEFSTVFTSAFHAGCEGGTRLGVVLDAAMAERLEGIELLFPGMFDDLQLFSAGLAKLSSEAADASIASEAALRAVGTITAALANFHELVLLGLLTEHESLRRGNLVITVPDSNSTGSRRGKKSAVKRSVPSPDWSSPDAIEAALSKLPSKSASFQKYARAGIEAVQSKCQLGDSSSTPQAEAASDAVTRICKLATLTKMVARPVDGKGLRVLAHSYRLRLLSRLAATDDPQRVLVCAVALILLRVHGAAVCIQGEGEQVWADQDALGGLIALCAKSLKVEHVNDLRLLFKSAIEQATADASLLQRVKDFAVDRTAGQHDE